MTNWKEKFYKEFEVIEYITKSNQIRRSIIAKDGRKNKRESDVHIISFIQSLLQEIGEKHEKEKEVLIKSILDSQENEDGDLDIEEGDLIQFYGRANDDRT